MPPHSSRLATTEPPQRGPARSSPSRHPASIVPSAAAAGGRHLRPNIGATARPFSVVRFRDAAGTESPARLAHARRRWPTLPATPFGAIEMR